MPQYSREMLPETGISAYEAHTAGEVITRRYPWLPKWKAFDLFLRLIRMKKRRPH